MRTILVEVPDKCSKDCPLAKEKLWHFTCKFRNGRYVEKMYRHSMITKYLKPVKACITADASELML